METFPFAERKPLGCFDDAKLEIQTLTEVKLSFIEAKFCYMKHFFKRMNE